MAKGNLMDRMTQVIDEKLSPAFGAFADLPFVSAMGRAFNVLLPITMIGALASLLTGISWEPYSNFLNSTGLSTILTLVNSLTLNMLSLYLAGSLGYYYSDRLGIKKQQLVIAFISIYALILSTPITAIESVNYVNISSFGSQAIFSALVIGALTVRIYKLCVDHKIYIKMPQGVPEFITSSFAGIVPAFFVTVVFVALGKGFNALGYDSLTTFIYAIISIPLSYLTSNPFFLMILIWIPSLFWFFGIHGANATNAFLPAILMPLAMENSAAYAAGVALPHIITFGFMQMGASSSLNMIWSVLLLRSKHKRFKELGKLSIVPGWFGISEPTKFGIPLVLNPYLAIPQIVYPFIGTILTYLVMLIGIVPRPSQTYVFGIPWPFAGLFQCGIMGVVWQLVMFALMYVMTLPFWKAYEKRVIAEESLEAMEGE